MKLGVNPGNNRATLAAGCAGQPVCIAIQTTHTIKAQPEKKSSVNQSINAATLRRNVGRANTAKLANAGNDSSKVCSDDRVSNAVPTVSAVNHMGSTK